ncbi:MAG: class I SAM-dependent methyltransferase [Pseudomonadota bacterium]
MAKRLVSDDFCSFDAPDVLDYMSKKVTDKQSPFAWSHFHEIVTDMLVHFGSHEVLEIGGGRSPFLSRQIVEKNDLHYTVNDISSSELARAPDWVSTSCFDIAGTEISDHNQYDFIFSKMVIEHVTDARQAYRNIFNLLKPDGVYFNFHPLLYSPPFIVNYLLPETLSRKILRFFFPRRNDEGIPKFPAFYSYCVVSDRTEKMLREIGFSHSLMMPFWGHNYFDRMPVIRQVDERVHRWAQNHDVKQLASFCYSVGQR